MKYSADGPLFLDSCGRSVFVQRFLADANLPFQGTVLHLPAFAEEMNKSRAMVASQAREMAGVGYDVLLPDYFGTGDSGGEFCEASWEIWLEDMQNCLAQLSRKPLGPLVLWGLRLGGLMAMQLSGELETQPSRLILWNPVLSGEQYMQQFLRLRLANSMMYGESKEKAADLKKHLEDKGCLEVAGYELSNDMFMQLCSRNAESLDIPAVTHVLWGEVSPSVKGLTIPAQKLVNKWCEGKLSVEVQSIDGSQFWATQEISRAEKLIEKTTDWLSAPLSSPHPSPLPKGEGIRSMDNLPEGEGRRSMDDLPEGEGTRSTDELPEGEGTRSTDELPEGERTKYLDDLSEGEGAGGADQSNSGSSFSPRGEG